MRISKRNATITLGRQDTRIWDEKQGVSEAHSFRVKVRSQASALADSLGRNVEIRYSSESGGALVDVVLTRGGAQ